jgi:hypothetical protein
MSDRISFSMATLLAWAVAAYSILTGIQGIMAWDSDSARFGRNVAEFFGQTSSPSALIIAILMVIAGAILLIASLCVLKPNLFTIALVLVIAFWVFKAVVELVVGKHFKPETLIWWKDLAWYLVICLAVWQTRRVRA